MGVSAFGDRVKAIRISLAALGVLLGAIGVKYLMNEDVPDLADALIWLAGGVLVHDAILAPATLVLMVVATRFLPEWLRGPMAAGFVLLATVTIAAIAVLGRFGARADNPTLLDRNYVGGWLVFAGVVVLGVSLAAARKHARITRESSS